MSEAWIPRLDSYTTYLGIQSLDLAPGSSFYAFKTLSSDDVEWSVFFNTVTKLPQFAISENISGQSPSQTVIIKSYIPRAVFGENEFMPVECYEERRSQKVEGPIMPLADFGLVY